MTESYNNIRHIHLNSYSSAGPCVTLSSKLSKSYLKLKLIYILLYRNPTPVADELLGVTWSPVVSNELNYLNIDSELTMNKDLMKENINFWDNIFPS